MMRKAVWRLMVRAMPREVARFIQSCFGELSVSKPRCEDILSETVSHYPRYLDTKNRFINVCSLSLRCCLSGG